jgi:hypothetical protein
MPLAANSNLNRNVPTSTVPATLDAMRKFCCSSIGDSLEHGIFRLLAVLCVAFVSRMVDRSRALATNQLHKYGSRNELRNDNRNLS